ncbi:MAG: type VI secretion system-associated FHA domain protein TagH [Pseudomonadota bacterium]
MQLEIVSEHKELVGDDAVREFREDGGTIGRSLHNDWILPDPDRYISGKHAAIDYRGGIYYLTDLSSNGVYLNHDNEPIGKGNTRRLFDGDTLHLGDFKIKVALDDNGETLSITDDAGAMVHHDNMARKATMITPMSTGVDLIDEEAITGGDAFERAVFGKPANEPKRPDPNQPDIIDVGQPQDTPEGVFAAFLDGLGIERSDLHADIDLKEVMKQAGEVLREYVKGTEQLLVNRSNLKTNFNLNQTTVLPRNNNPLKLSQNTDDSIKQLLVGKEGGEYLCPKDAVREISLDLMVHQDAFIEAMSAAFADFADRFDPAELTHSFDQTMGKKPKLKLLGEQKYWQLYTELYPILTETGGGRFPHMLAEEFVKAYERYVADANRPNVDKTQRWEPIIKDQGADHAETQVFPDEKVDPEISAELEALPNPEEKSA